MPHPKFINQKLLAEIENLATNALQTGDVHLNFSDKKEMMRWRNQFYNLKKRVAVGEKSPLFEVILTITNEHCLVLTKGGVFKMTPTFADGSPVKATVDRRKWEDAKTALSYVELKNWIYASSSPIYQKDIHAKHLEIERKWQDFANDGIIAKVYDKMLEGIDAQKAAEELLAPAKPVYDTDI